MSESPPPSDQGDPSGSRIRIAVVRSGGIAGMRRRWQVEPAPEEAPRWIALIERCPWDADEPDAAQRDAVATKNLPETDAPESQRPTPRGADRFVWRIHARLARTEHERQLPDSALSGPWRDLVDAVRAAQ